MLLIFQQIFQALPPFCDLALAQLAEGDAVREPDVIVMMELREIVQCLLAQRNAVVILFFLDQDAAHEGVPPFPVRRDDPFPPFQSHGLFLVRQLVRVEAAQIGTHEIGLAGLVLEDIDHAPYGQGIRTVRFLPAVLQDGIDSAAKISRRMGPFIELLDIQIIEAPAVNPMQVGKIRKGNHAGPGDFPAFPVLLRLAQGIGIIVIIPASPRPIGSGLAVHSQDLVITTVAAGPAGSKRIHGTTSVFFHSISYRYGYYNMQKRSCLKRQLLFWGLMFDVRY